MARQEPVAEEEAEVRSPPARWPRFRLWAISLAGGIAAASGTLLLPPPISLDAPFWAPYALDVLRFLVLWYLSRVLVRSFFTLAEWLFDTLFPPPQTISSNDG